MEVAYGDRADLDEIKELIGNSSEHRAIEALEFLADRVTHQGWTYRAAPTVVAWFLDALFGVAPAVQARILQLLPDILAPNRELDAVLARFRLRLTDHQKAVRSEIGKRLPDLATLLCAGDVDVRVSACYLIGWASEDLEWSRSLILADLAHHERSNLERVNQMLLLGLLGVDGSEVAPYIGASECAALAAIACDARNLGRITDGQREYFKNAIRHAGPSGWLPWSDGSFPCALFTVAAPCQSECPEFFSEIAGSLLDSESVFETIWLLRLFFEAIGLGSPGDASSKKHLGPSALNALRTLSRSHRIWSAPDGVVHEVVTCLEGHGLPGTRSALHEFVENAEANCKNGY